MEHSIDREAGPASWADLMDIDSMDKGAALWSDADLGAVLRHQMSASLQADLSLVDAKRFADVQRSSEGGQSDPVSFFQLLHHATPSVELLDLTRQFAKSCMTVSNGPLPLEVASVLYYSSILIARTRCGARISRLEDSALMRGVRTALNWTWLDPATRQLMDDGAKSLADLHVSGDIAGDTADK